MNRMNRIITVITLFFFPCTTVAATMIVASDKLTENKNFQPLPKPSSTPVPVATPMMTTNGRTDQPNFQPWPLRSFLPFAVAAPVMVATHGLTKKSNLQSRRSSPYHCHCGHRAEVTKCDLVNGCYHDHSTAATDPHLSTVYTRSGYNYNYRITATELNQARTYTAVTDARYTEKPDNRQTCHHQPQQTSDSTPSPLDNSVTEDIYYDESGEDNDDEYFPIKNFVLIILLVVFVLLYPSFYFYSNQRKKTNWFYLQTNNCGCRAKYIPFSI